MKIFSGKLLVGLVLCFALTGCATWSTHGVVLHSQRVPVAVLPVYSEVAIRRLNDIRTPAGETAVSAASQPALIRQEMQQVEGRIRSDVENGLRDSYFFEVIPEARVGEALATLGLESSAVLFSTNQIIALGCATGAKAILMTRIAGYGKTLLSGLKPLEIRLIVDVGLMEFGWMLS